MTANKTKKGIFIIGLLLSLAALVIWAGFGAEVFTKTQVLIEKKDELFGTTYKEWKSQFVLGLDYTIGFISIMWLIIGSTLLYKKFYSKNK